MFVSKSLITHHSSGFFLMAVLVFASFSMGCSTQDGSLPPFKPDPLASLPGREAPVATTSFLTKVDSCDALRTKLVDEATETILQYPQVFVGRLEVDDDLIAPRPPAIEVGAGIKGRGPLDDSLVAFTKTNNQEVDADEVDWVKTNGTYTYVLKGKTLTLLKTWGPSEPKVVKKFDLNNYARNQEQFYREGVDFTKPYESKKDNLGHLFERRDDRGGYGHRDNNGTSIGGDSLFDWSNVTSSQDKAEELTPLGLAYDNNRNRLYLFASFRAAPSEFVLRNKGVLEEDDNFKTLSGGFRVITFDVSQPESPTVKSITDFDASYDDARTVQSGTYTIEKVNLARGLGKWMEGAHYDTIKKLLKPIFSLPLGVEPPNKREGLEKFREYRKKVREIMEKRTKKARYRVHDYLSKNLSNEDLQKILPKRYSFNKDFELQESAPILGCQDIYLSPVGNKFYGLAVTKLPGDHGDAPKSVGLLASFSTVYATGSHLYLGQYFYRFLQDWKGEEFTAIHKFAFDDKEAGLSYQASGKVPGALLNQFSLSEYNGHLRVVTTIVDEEKLAEKQEDHLDGRGRNKVRPAVGSPQPHGTPAKPLPAPQGEAPVTQLTILKQSDNTLEKVGEISGLAKGEYVYAARFVGDRGYVVTFRQVDPLFTFDLSNPKEPKQLGALKVTGFSTYIHPLDDTHLLTIGREADSQGNVGGLKLEVFDVSDLKNPQPVTNKYVIPQGKDGLLLRASSAAEEDHRAFTFDPALNLLSIPVQNYKAGEKAFDGFQYFSVSPTDGVQKVGEINYLKEDGVADCGQKTDHDEKLECFRKSDYFGYGMPKYRSIIMREASDGTLVSSGGKAYIYTLSPLGLVIQEAEGAFPVSLVVKF